MSTIVTRLREAGDQLLQSGSSHELTTVAVNGVDLRVYRNAPASLRDALGAGREHGDKAFIVYEGERWTFRKFFEQVDALGNLLHTKFGIKKGERVAIAMRNYPEWMVAYTAIVSIGAVVVPLNSWGQAEELEYGLSDAGARLVVCDQQRLDYISSRLQASGLQAVVVRPENALPDGAHEWDALLAEVTGASLPEVEINADDLVMIMYTSGTTGRPKGAASTNRAICQTLYNFEFHAYASAMANPDSIGKMMNAGFEPSTLLVVPLFHVSGCFAVFMLNLRGGRKTAIMYKWDVDKALELIEQERITTFTGVPAMSLALLESPAFDETDTSSLFAIGLGGAATPPHLADLIYRKLPDSYPGTGYGMTETNAAGATCTGEAFRCFPGTAGNISPIVDIKTVAEDGRDLSRGETGEIFVRSPTNVQEYWNLPDATAESFRGGWLATGDVGYVDDNNFIFIVDRIKDMVIRGGENIYPVEVEGCILEHPDVVEVTAYGVPHDSWGEELAVTLYSTTGIGAADLQAWVKERLAGFKVPAHVVVQGEPLPKNATGKVLKKQVRQAYLDSL
jgi:acyl-CoA synthetase (AMP-forming)/AMP-acid ligase II